MQWIHTIPWYLLKNPTVKIVTKLECGPMPNVMVALPNTGGTLC